MLQGVVRYYPPANRHLQRTRQERASLLSCVGEVKRNVRLLRIIFSESHSVLKEHVVLHPQSSAKQNTEIAKEARGAYVNCWIDFREKEGAEHLAKFYLERAGWDHEETQEAIWVQKEDYDDDSEAMRNFLDAEAERKFRRSPVESQS